MIPGREQLREWMTRAKLNQRAAAKVLGMHYTFLSQILNNLRSPALGTAVRIEQLTGVPAESWVPTSVAPQKRRHAVARPKRRVYRA